MIQELASVISIVETFEIDVAQKENLLRLMRALEEQFKTYDFRLERAGKDKVSLITLFTRKSDYLDENEKNERGKSARRVKRCIT